MEGSEEASNISAVVGYVAVSISIFAWGTFGVFMKTKKMQDISIDPMVFQLYMTVAIFITSFFVLIYTQKFLFTWYGVFGALLWTIGSVCSVYGIQNLGLSVAQGTWSGLIIIVSFVWGLKFGEHVKNIGLTVLGLILLLVGVCGIAFSNKIGGSNESVKLDSAVNDEETRLTNDKPKDRFKVAKGVFFVVMVGSFAGSTLIPLKLIDAEYVGIIYAVSFGIGVMIVTPVLAIFYFALIVRKKPVFYIYDAALPATASGILWNCGNLGSIMATASPLGLTVGYPLCQCALLVAGLWGIIYFREIKGGLKIGFFFISAVVLLAGAGLLSIFG